MAESRTLGDLVREYRLAIGITQEELAERAGVSPRSISEIERGGPHVPRRDTLSLLARALELSGRSRQAFEATAERRRSARRTPEPRSRPDQPQDDSPRSLTRFIGRQRDLEGLALALADAPLVTLVGPGGVGKTRLAEEFFRAARARFADGCWDVELASVLDPALVPSAIARTIGVREVRPEQLRPMLVNHIGQKHVLLLLDNCEHLIEACAEVVADLLARCPHLQILATSREPLAIHGEVLWHVLPLEVPSEAPGKSLDDLPNSPAVQLFVDRACALAQLELTPSNAQAIARICASVDGIPLALELAAAASRVLGLQELADRLEADVGVLSGSNRLAPLRHRTVRATIDWSHDLLSAREQRLFRRLSVFARGWSLEAAEDVCTDDDLGRTDVLDVLTSLADKSLIVVDARGSSARYRFLESVRQYALERLASSDEVAEYRARHAAYFVALARSGVEGEGPEEILSIDRIELEHANVRAALAWALDHGQTEAAVTSAVALFRFWERRGHFPEGCAWLEQAMARDDFAELPAPIRSGALNALAFLYWRGGAADRAAPIARRALDVSHAADFKLGLAHALLNLGMCAYLQHDYASAEASLEQTVQFAREIDRPAMLSVALSFLARVVVARYAPCDSRLPALVREAVSLAHAARSRYASGHALATEGDVHWAHNDVSSAVSAWKGALILFSDLADPRGTAGCIERLALALLRYGNIADAAWLFGAADAQHTALGMPLRANQEVDHAHFAQFADQQRAREACADGWFTGRTASVHDSVARAIGATSRIPA